MRAKRLYIQAIARLHCIGEGWDPNIIKMSTKHLIAQSLEDQTRVYLASLAISSTPIHLDQGEKFYLLQKEPEGAFHQLVASLANDSIVQAAKVVALSEHYRRTSEPDDYSSTSIIDTGAPLRSKHVTFLDIGCEDSDSDEEMPFPHSQSEDEGDIYLEDFIDSDSDDEVITSHYSPSFNQTEEGDGSNDEPLYEDKEHQVDTNNYEELQDITKLKATREGQTADETVPRSNIETLRSFEVMNTTFIVDLGKVKSEVPEEKPDQRSEDLLTSKFVKNIPLPAVAKDSNTPTHQEASPGLAPEGDDPSPLIDNNPSIVMEDYIVFIPQDDVYSATSPPPTSLYGRELHPRASYVPHASGIELKINTVQEDPRAEYLINMSKIQQLDNDLERYNAAIERASQNLKAKTKNETDGAAYLIAAQSMADHAQKDMNWKKALDSEHRKPAIEALNNELTSLQKTILTEVFPTDPTYEVAVLNATPGRLLLDIKRSGKYKVRGVKQGFRENTFAPEGDMSSPLTDNDPSIITEDCTFAISPTDTGHFDIDTSQDYLGIPLHTDHKYMYLDLSAYTEDTLDILDISSRKSSTPIASPTNTDSSLLDIGQKREYLTALGMLSWLTQPVRCDVSYTSSSPEQHRATATHSTLNVDRQNRHRSQNDLVITNKDLPVNWQSNKVSTTGLTSTEEAKIVAAQNATADPAPM